jgi:hypothetical protein
MFASNSRYYSQPVDIRTLADGRTVSLVRPPLPGPPVIKGYHRRQNGQRLDLIANNYLADPTTTWWLCDANNAVVPDALAAHDLVGVPFNAPAGT